VLDLIERKAQGEEVVFQAPPAEEPEPAPDLMSALKASLEAVRERDGAAEPTGNGKPAKRPAAKKKPAAKKAAAKKAAAKRPGDSRATAKR
jgi:non-homologous end joining protein Ku